MRVARWTRVLAGGGCGARLALARPLGRTLTFSLDADRAELPGHREGGLQRLLVVEARVAPRLVVRLEVLLRDAHAAARALRHRLLPGELEVDACEDRTRLAVHRQGVGALGHDVVEGARLEPDRLGGDGVAVHPVALPYHRDARRLDRSDVAGQVLLDLVVPVARDDDELARLLVGVEHRHELRQLVVLHAGAHLDADRVGDAAEVLHVPAEHLARAVADPDHVCAEVVVRVAHRPRERLLEVELHRLVGGVERGRASRLLHARRYLDVLRVRRALGREADVQVEELAQVSRHAQRAQVVKRGGRVVVALEQTLGVPLALLWLVAVDVVALERHDLAVALDDLGRLGARLAVLARDTRDDDGRHAGRLADDRTHLHEHLELRLEPLSLAVDEALGAVAALHDEGLARGRLGEQRLERVALARLHERRQLGELGDHARLQHLVLVLGHLLALEHAPRARGPGARRDRGRVRHA
mmetsp:Transcript_24894/g.63087  ORF Transcript_24894/g.63087 Transcript_24894/m.63087 type:complete len:473 (+) Transcript_24894:280-1698(+)